MWLANAHGFAIWYAGAILTELVRHLEKSINPVLRVLLVGALSWAFKSVPQVYPVSASLLWFIPWSIVQRFGILVAICLALHPLPTRTLVDSAKSSQRVLSAAF